ncbi:MAG: hypothetical protein ILO36_05670 [Abditibacteriota bacterium]|nr:hypothetical protein [Abditibacteriota bacterium]
MKRSLVLTAVLLLMAVSAAFCAKIGVIENGKIVIKGDAPDPCFAAEGAKFEPIPEEFAEYKDDVSDVTVYEYTDAIVIEKKTAAYTSPGLYVRIDSPFFTGKAGEYDWMQLPVKFPEGSVQDEFVKRGTYQERDRIYGVSRTGDGIRVTALIPDFVQHGPLNRDEHVVVDTVTGEKLKGKTLVMRKTSPVWFHQSANIDKASPVPEKAELLTENIIRLQFKDGAVEHWLLELTAEDMRKNLEMYKGDDESVRSAYKCRSLVWHNGVERKLSAEAAKMSPEDKKLLASAGSGQQKRSEAWCFDPDTSREPVYEGQTEAGAPETGVAAVRKGFFAGMFAKISGFFKGLFGFSAA